MHKVCAHVFVTLQLRVGAQNCCYTVHTNLVSLTVYAILLRGSVTKQVYMGSNSVTKKRWKIPHATLIFYRAIIMFQTLRQSLG